MKRFNLLIPFILAVCLMFTPASIAGINDRFSDIELGDSGDNKNAIIIPERAAPTGNPASNYGWIYVKDSGGASALYFENDAGAVSQLTPSATAYDDIGDPDANSVILFTTYTNTWTMAATAGDAFNIQGTGAFGDISVVRIEQITGNPTDGTVLEVVAADPNVDPLVISASGKANALVVGQNTGVVTIAGVAEGTDALIITKGDIHLFDGDLDVGGGDATFSEDVTIVGDLFGGTGVINYTNFDVDASGNVITAGNVTAVNGTFSGNVLVTGAIKLDALVPASGAPHDITIDGAGAGGVVLGATSTGDITLGGGATTVNLPANVDLTLTQGDVTVTDTANTTTVAITNNTATTASLLTLSGNSQTSGNGVSYGNTGTVLTGAAYYAAVTDGDGFTGYYFRAYDGAADDFAVRRYGATTIAGNASTNVLTVTTGDVQIDDGKVEIDTNEDDTTKVERAQATVTGPVFSVIEQTDTVASGKAALFIDQDSTANTSSALEIDTEGAYAIKIDALIAAGDGVLIDVADSYTGQGIIADLGPWLGTTGEGFVSITSDSGAVNEVGQAIRVNLQGTGTAGTAVTGKALYAHSQAAVKAGESLVYLDTLTNTALHINNEGAAADGIKFDVANTYTGQGILADLGPWTGTAGEGFIELNSDNAATIPAGQFIRMRQLGTGQHAAAIGGTLLYMEDDAVAPAAGTSYVMYIDATNIEAIHVDTGKVLVDETVTATGGLSSGNASLSLLYTDTINITNGQIKGLVAAPKELIATPGAGKFIEVVSLTLTLDYAGTNVFTCGGADDLVVEYGTTGVDITGSIETTGWIDQAADQIKFVPVAGIASTTLANVVNRSVVLFNTGADIAGNAGNDNDVEVIITYRIHDDGV